MKTLVFCLEEPSAKAMLEGILSRILPPDVKPFYVVFSGKQDLEKQLVKRLKGWLQPNTAFLIMRDQDSGDCKHIKQNLLNLAQQADKSTVLVRIACHELESFYLGDLSAVEQGLGLKNLAKQQHSRKFRHPDQLANAAEELKKLTKGQYQKLLGSRAIAPHLSLEDNQSLSFNALINGIQKLLSEL